MDQAQAKPNPAEIIFILIWKKKSNQIKKIGDFPFFYFLKINFILKLEFFQEIFEIN